MRDTVKGKRPAFHDNASIDRLISMVLALASETAVLRDRLATMEALGRDAGWLKDGAVDAYTPSLPERTAREAARDAMLGRLFHVLKEELDDLHPAEQGDYWETIGKVERGEV
jgi:hypothetical protein